MFYYLTFSFNGHSEERAKRVTKNLTELPLGNGYHPTVQACLLAVYFIYLRTFDSKGAQTAGVHEGCRERCTLYQYRVTPMIPRPLFLISILYIQ